MNFLNRTWIVIQYLLCMSDIIKKFYYVKKKLNYENLLFKMHKLKWLKLIKTKKNLFIMFFLKNI